MRKSNIVLIGMPSTGKSTLAVLMANALKKNLVDTDELISKNAEISCQQFMDEYGLKAYSDFENKTLMSIEQDNLVIATGGSAVYCNEAMQYLKQNAIILHLSASFETLETRITNFETRAIVMSENMTFLDLYNERMPLYREIADIELPTDAEGDTPEKSLNKAIQAIDLYLS